MRGAYGAALLMAEYYDHLKSSPDALAAAAQRDAPHANGAHHGARSPAARLSDVESASEPEEEGEHAAVPTPVSHALTSDAAHAAARAAFARDPGSAHGEVAREELHWFHPAKKAWLTWRDGGWAGWDAASGDPVVLGEADGGGAWTPWHTALDGGRAPFFRWFDGGLTSAAFNECDRHVLAGHGDETAFVSVSMEAFAAHQTRPGALKAACPSMTRRTLLYQSVLAAHVLRELGVRQGDRIILLMPHCIEQVVWMQAAKRLGALYVSMPGNISLKALSNRMNDCGARLVLTTAALGPTGASLKAMVSRAVAELVPVSIVMDVVREQLVAAAEAQLGAGRLGLKNAPAEICEALKQTFASQAGCKVASAPSEDRAPSAPLDHLKAPAAPTQPRAPLQPLGSVDFLHSSAARLRQSQG